MVTDCQCLGTTGDWPWYCPTVAGSQSPKHVESIHVLVKKLNAQLSQIPCSGAIALLASLLLLGPRVLSGRAGLRQVARWVAGAARTQCHRLEGWNNRHHFLRPRGYESEIKPSSTCVFTCYSLCAPLSQVLS